MILFGGPALRCSVRLRRTHAFEKGIVNISMVLTYHLLLPAPGRGPPSSQHGFYLVADGVIERRPAGTVLDPRIGAALQKQGDKFLVFLLRHRDMQRRPAGGIGQIRIRAIIQQQFQRPFPAAFAPFFERFLVLLLFRAEPDDPVRPGPNDEMQNPGIIPEPRKIIKPLHIRIGPVFQEEFNRPRLVRSFIDQLGQRRTERIVRRVDIESVFQQDPDFRNAVVSGHLDAVIRIEILE